MWDSCGDHIFCLFFSYFSYGFTVVQKQKNQPPNPLWATLSLVKPLLNLIKHLLSGVYWNKKKQKKTHPGNPKSPGPLAPLPNPLWARLSFLGWVLHVPETLFTYNIYIQLRLCLYILVQITPNFGSTRFMHSYERKHPQQNSCLSVCLYVCVGSAKSWSRFG